MTFGSRFSLVLALVLGGAAAFLVRGVLLGMPAEQTSRTIVVARGPIAFGAPLTPENLRETPWSAAEPMDGSFATVGELLGSGKRLALASFGRSEPILNSKVTAPNQRASLSTQLDEGMRAVTIRVDEVRGVAGFVLPGDRVDVILTRGEGSAQDAAAYADLLLQNAKVLAVDQLADGRQDKPTVARAVTMELSVQQAQKVVLAQGIGRLSLVLRQAGEDALDPGSRVTASDLGGAGGATRDRVAELERRLEGMKAAEDAARADADRRQAQLMADIEMRLRGEMAARPPALVPIQQPPAQQAASNRSATVTVTRNGSKTESYTVVSER